MFYNYIKYRSNISIAIIKNKISGHWEMTQSEKFLTHKLEEQSLDPQQNMITRCGAYIYHPVHGLGQRQGDHCISLVSQLTGVVSTGSVKYLVSSNKAESN